MQECVCARAHARAHAHAYVPRDLQELCLWHKMLPVIQDQVTQEPEGHPEGTGTTGSSNLKDPGAKLTLPILPAAHLVEQHSY